MKKLLSVAPALLLFAMIGAPNACADSYTPTFSCTGGCPLGVLTGGDISFPIAGSFASDLLTLPNVPPGNPFFVSFSAADSASDLYLWSIVPSDDDEARFSLTIQDETDGELTADSILGASSGFSGEGGILMFSPASAAAPEPAPIMLMLLGAGLIFSLRKRVLVHTPRTA